MTSSSQRGNRGLFWGIGLAVATVSAGMMLLALNRLSTVPVDGGRPEPAQLLEDPAHLIDDPGAIGAAVERNATTAVRSCMEAAGFTYEGLAAAEPLDTLLQPAFHGYGIATGPRPRPDVYRTAAGSGDDAYETALYGRPLRELDPGSPLGGCAAAGWQRLDADVAALARLPYSIVALQDDVADDERYVVAERAWAACMTDRGYRVTTPDELVSSFTTRLATVGGDEAVALADEERRTAVDDFDCRSRTLDPVVNALAADYGEAFLAANRAELAALITADPEQALGEPAGLGTGDIQVTLLWSTEVDLDLAVVDPAGDRVSYQNPAVPSGGALDRDANFPCGNPTPDPVENVYWPAGQAPAGDYAIAIRYQTGCGAIGPVDYRMILRINGVVAQDVSATITPDEAITVTFTTGGSGG